MSDMKIHGEEELAISPVSAPSAVYVEKGSSEAFSQSTLERLDKERSAADLLATLIGLTIPVNNLAEFKSLIEKNTQEVTLDRFSQLSIKDRNLIALNAVLQLQDTFQEILSNWTESLQKIAEESRKADKKKEIEDEILKKEILQSQRLQDQIVKDAAIQAKNLQRFSVAFLDAVSTFRHDKFEQGGSIDPLGDVNKFREAFFGVMTLGIVTAAGVKEMMMPEVSSLVAVNPIQEASSQIISTQFPDKQQQDLALLTINLFVTAAFYAAEIEAFKTGKIAQEMTKEFAKEFAVKVVGIVTDNDIFSHLIQRALINKKDDKEIIDNEKIKVFGLKVKILMLLMALTVLYKARYDGATGAEIQAFLVDSHTKEGERILPEDIAETIRRHLIGGVTGSKGLLDELSEGDRADVLAKFYAFIDTNQSLKQLMKPFESSVNALFGEALADPTPAA